MNELAGPLYYTLATDKDEGWRREAEADAFFCFQNLMSEVKDQFIKSLDDTAVGIGLPNLSPHTARQSLDIQGDNTTMRVQNRLHSQSALPDGVSKELVPRPRQNEGIITLCCRTSLPLDVLAIRSHARA